MTQCFPLDQHVTVADVAYVVASGLACMLLIRSMYAIDVLCSFARTHKHTHTHMMNI